MRPLDNAIADVHNVSDETGVNFQSAAANVCGSLTSDELLELATLFAAGNVMTLKAEQDYKNRDHSREEVLDPLCALNDAVTNVHDISNEPGVDLYGATAGICGSLTSDEFLKLATLFASAKR